MMCCVLGLFFYLGGQNETRLGSVITRFTVGGSGFPSSRSGCRVGANISMSRGLVDVGAGLVG